MTSICEVSASLSSHPPCGFGDHPMVRCALIGIILAKRPDSMPLSTILLLVLLLLLIGALPRWPHSRTWGYYPSGGLGLILVIVIVMVLLGYI